MGKNSRSPIQLKLFTCRFAVAAASVSCLTACPASRDSKPSEIYAPDPGVVKIQEGIDQELDQNHLVYEQKSKSYTGRASLFATCSPEFQDFLFRQLREMQHVVHLMTTKSIMNDGSGRTHEYVAGARQFVVWAREKRESLQQLWRETDEYCRNDAQLVETCLEGKENVRILVQSEHAPGQTLTAVLPTLHAAKEVFFSTADGRLRGAVMNDPVTSSIASVQDQIASEPQKIAAANACLANQAVKSRVGKQIVRSVSLLHARNQQAQAAAPGKP